MARLNTSKIPLSFSMSRTFTALARSFEVTYTKSFDGYDPKHPMPKDLTWKPSVTFLTTTRTPIASSPALGTKLAGSVKTFSFEGLS